MDYDTFKLIHSELIMSVQYIEQDLKIIYSTLKKGEFNDNYSLVSNAPMGKMLKEFKELDKELGYSKIKEKDYELLDKIREMRNYWCHRCYIDFHYIEDEKEHYEAFLKVAEQLCHDENCIYELQQKIEKLRKSVVRKYKYRK